jgi:hypothetical protein
MRERTNFRLRNFRFGKSAHESASRILTILALLILISTHLAAQGGRGGGPPAPAGPPPTPKAAAPFDPTGYWVSLVTEDWRYRMANPPKGDYVGIPLTPEGRKLADAWDPAKDEAAGEQCRSYGAAAIMRQPTRLHITWENDNTLKIETDAGTQTRILNFNGPQGQGGDWQGISTATWERNIPVMGPGRGGGGAVPPGGSLKVVTTKMKPGYLRRNGVSYSANAVMTEYIDRLEHPNGDSLLLVSTEVVDPVNLTTPFWTSTHFKKQRDAAGWNPTPCSAR